MEDAARTTAESKTEAVLNRFNYFESMETVGKHLSRILHRGNKTFVMIDCITSKSRVALHHLTEFGVFLTNRGHGRGSGQALKVRLVVTTGTRLDFTSAVGNKIATDCSTLEKYLVQITCGPAQNKKAATLLLGCH